MSKPDHELATVIRLYKTLFTDKHQPLKQHLSVLNAIEKCRTASLGGHVDACDSCGHIRISYNSCRNRHCPKCQGTNREQWVATQQQQLLPVTYFHVVFTLPQELNSFCMHYPGEMYNLLFNASKQTISAFAQDAKHLGAAPGMISVLHTWGQTLCLHPHIHMIVPGGGITAAGYWKNAKCHGNYLFPVKAMSTVFKNKYMQGFLKLLETKNIAIEKIVRETLYTKSWVVYARQPFLGASQVIEYLGRYTHKVAISNHRIQSIANGKVSFTYKDYADGCKQKQMTLAGTEFLRRFCMHILPPRFTRIRHYGFLANTKRAMLQLQQKEMGIAAAVPVKKDWKTIVREKMHFDVEQCPCCKKGKMITIFNFEANAPPHPGYSKIAVQQRRNEMQ